MMHALVANSTSVSCKMWVTYNHSLFKPETDFAVYYTSVVKKSKPEPLCP